MGLRLCGVPIEPASLTGIFRIEERAARRQRATSPRSAGRPRGSQCCVSSVLAADPKPDDTRDGPQTILSWKSQRRPKPDGWPSLRTTASARSSSFIRTRTRGACLASVHVSIHNHLIPRHTQNARKGGREIDHPSRDSSRTFTTRRTSIRGSCVRVPGPIANAAIRESSRDSAVRGNAGATSIRTRSGPIFSGVRFAAGPWHG